MIIESLSYRNSFFAAVTLHVLIAIALLIEATNTRPVLVASKQPQASQSQPLALEQKETIKAVSVNSEDVMKTGYVLYAIRLICPNASETLSVPTTSSLTRMGRWA